VSIPYDYEANPARYRLGMQVTQANLDAATTPLHERIWQLLPERDDLIVADVGCADGALAAARPRDRAGHLVGLDLSAALLRDHPSPSLRADAAALPLRDQSVTAVVAVNMLYHLDHPLLAIRAARRALAADGVFIAATISRHDSPELADVWRPAPSTFDAEDAPALAGQVFTRVETERWDAPLITLPDAAAVRDYLIARFVPPGQAAAAASRLRTPLSVTKRGALVICGG
jgi:SAM-dependent methyltransferase